MASAGNIKVVKLGTDEYELLAKYIQDQSGNAKTWADIEALVNVGLKIVIDEKHATKDEPKTAASADTMGKLYLVQLTTTISGVYTEFVTIRSGAEGSYTYAWEQIGSTEVDLSNYVKKGSYTSDSQGAHTHTVSGTVTVPTISKTDKKMSATATDGAVGIKTTAAAITGFGTHTTDNTLGEATTFAVSGDVAKTNVSATASGTAVAGDGTAAAITALGTPTTANAITGFGDHTTAAAITGFGDHTTANAITGFGSHTTDNALGEATSFNVTGDVAKTNISATASGTALSTSDDTFLQSYPGETSKMVIGTVTGINGSTSVPSSVSATDGVAASWSASVDNKGALSFSWTTNTPTAVTVGSDVTVAKPADSASSFVTGLSASGTGDTVMTGLGTAVSSKALTAASVQTQPTITLATGATAGAGVIEVATGVGTVGVTANKDDLVASITALGTPTTAAAITALGTPTTAAAITALGTATTAAAITGFGTHTTADVLTGVKVTAQPTVALATNATAGAGVVELATGVGTIAVSANKDDVVASITALGTPTTANAATEIEVTAQPTITLNADASTGIDYVQSVTLGTNAASLTDGAAAEAGAHTHTTTLS